MMLSYPQYFDMNWSTVSTKPNLCTGDFWQHSTGPPHNTNKLYCKTQTKTNIL